MIALLLLTLAAVFAAEPPAPPEPHAPVEGQCAEALAVQAGTLAPCRGVLLPTNWAADLQAQIAWGELVANRYRLDTAALERQVAAEQARALDLQRAASSAWWKDPPVVLVAGGVLGVAVTVAIVAAVGGAL